MKRTPKQIQQRFERARASLERRPVKKRRRFWYAILAGGLLLIVAADTQASRPADERSILSAMPEPIAVQWYKRRPVKKKQFAVKRAASKGTIAAYKRAPTACLPRMIKAALAKADKACGIKVISTLRRGAVIAGSGRRSRHATCEAADFTSKNYSCVKNALRNFPGKMSIDPFAVGHVHIDNGRYARFVHRGYRTRYARAGWR